MFKAQNKKRFFFTIKILFCILLILSGCASLPEMHQASLEDVRNGSYENALKYIEQNKGTLYGDKDTVVYDLDGGIIRHYAGLYGDSTKQLSDAEQLIYQYYTKSVSAEIGSFLVNDTLLDYAGEDYEDIYSNLFMSLNYFYQNEIDDAIVEVNRASNKIQELSSKHEPELIKARTAAKMDNQPAVDIQFHNSALAQYLAMLYNRAGGDMDEAFHDQHMISDAFLTQKQLYPFELPESVNSELKIPAGKTRLNFISFLGTSPVKLERRINLTADYVIAYPVMAVCPYPVHYVQAEITNTQTGETTECSLGQIESIRNIALDTFKIRSQIIYAKAVARCTVKGTTTVASRGIGEELSKNDDANVALAGSILKLFSTVNKISNQVTEAADLRISRYFPARADVGGVTLSPGTYNITVVFFDHPDGTVISSRSFENVIVQAGKLNLIEANCLGSSGTPVIPDNPGAIP
jgi:uncharacterized protein